MSFDWKNKVRVGNGFSSPFIGKSWANDKAVCPPYVTIGCADARRHIIV